MNLTFKHKLAAVASGAALLGGGGAALAVAGGSGGGRAPQQTFLNDVAKRLNVSSQQLKDAFAGALADRLDADVAAGRLTRQQADEIARHAKEHGGLPFPGFGPGGPDAGPPPPGAPPFGPPPFGPPPPGARGHHGPGGPFMAGLDAAAKYLGLTDGQLRAQLESGKSLAQVAADRNKPVDGLKSAIEDGVTSELDKAVADKRITKDEEQRELAELHSRIDDIVSRNPGAGRPGWRRGPHR